MKLPKMSGLVPNRGHPERLGLTANDLETNGLAVHPNHSGDELHTPPRQASPTGSNKYGGDAGGESRHKCHCCFVQINSLTRLFCCAGVWAVLVFYVVITIYQQSIRESGVGHTLVQCIWKSFAAQDTYSRITTSASSAAQWHNVTHLLTSHSHGFLGHEFPTDKAVRHNYTLNYDWLLEPYRNSAKNVMEIGVKKGGSLKLWREYFHRDAHIFGIDIDPAVPTFIGDSGGGECVIILLFKGEISCR